jgi:hypothetical protein
MGMGVDLTQWPIVAIFVAGGSAAGGVGYAILAYAKKNDQEVEARVEKRLDAKYSPELAEMRAELAEFKAMTKKYRETLGAIVGGTQEAIEALPKSHETELGITHIRQVQRLATDALALLS